MEIGATTRVHRLRHARTCHNFSSHFPSQEASRLYFSPLFTFFALAHFTRFPRRFSLVLPHLRSRRCDQQFFPRPTSSSNHRQRIQFLFLNLFIFEFCFLFVTLCVSCLQVLKSKHGDQAMLLLNWLFQDEHLFQPVAQALAGVVARKHVHDRYLLLGWCLLLRNLVEFETSAHQSMFGGEFRIFTLAISTRVLTEKKFGNRKSFYFKFIWRNKLSCVC